MIDVHDKLRILSAAAKYDASCASSGSRRPNTPHGTGNAARGGICHSWSDDGRCISLLKILLTNRCVYDCAYCVNRRSNDLPRASFTVEEVVDLTVNFYQRNYIEGLFLSSGVERSPNYTMERMVQVVRALRTQREFNGYVHLKAIPGADPELIQLAGLYADRLSVNIELPSAQSLHALCPDKSRNDILLPMGRIGEAIRANRDERRRARHTPRFAPAGQSTQMIVNASPENDRHILHLAESLYRRYMLKRVYYSAYIAVNDDSRLPWQPAPNMLREHRLYQADWLVRVYGFQSGELLDDEFPQLDEELDPKSAWALRHFDRFPVEVMRADYDTLLRVPGIGVRSAKRILATRRVAPVRTEHLAKLGVVMKRARHFLTCNGKYSGDARRGPAAIRPLILPGPGAKYQPVSPATQPELFGEL